MANPEERPNERMIEVERVTRDTQVSSVKQILNLQPVVVQDNHSLVEVAEEMIKAPNNIHMACVVNANLRLIGLLSLRSLADDLFLSVVPEEVLNETFDLEEALHFAELSATRTAGQAMIPAVWVKQNDTVKQAFCKMHENQISGIPVVNDRYQVTGYINLLELLAFYVRGQKVASKS